MRYSKLEGWKVDAFFTVRSLKGRIYSVSPSFSQGKSSSSLVSMLEDVSSCLLNSILCKNRLTLLATSSSSLSLATLPFLGDALGLSEVGERDVREDLLPVVQLPLRVPGRPPASASPASLLVSAATRDPPAPIGGKDCLLGWLSGGSKNAVGLSGRVGLIDVRSVKSTSVVPSEEILLLTAAGERLSTSDEFRGDAEADNKTCGVLYRRGNRGLSFLPPSFGDDASGRLNRFFIMFSASASSFWIFFFSRSISLPIDSLWKSMESSWIFSFLSAIEFMNIVLSAYSVLWYAMVSRANREVSATQ